MHPQPTYNQSYQQNNPKPKIKQQQQKKQNLMQCQQSVIQTIILNITIILTIINKISVYQQYVCTLLKNIQRMKEIIQQYKIQQDKLIKKIKKLEDVNLEYLKQYCQVKGKQFNITYQPQYKTIFRQVTLQEIKVQDIKQIQIFLINNVQKQLILENISRYIDSKKDSLIKEIQIQLRKQVNQQNTKQLESIKQTLQNYIHEIQSGGEKDFIMFFKKLVHVRNNLQQLQQKQKIVLTSNKQQPILATIIKTNKVQQLSQSSMRPSINQQKSQQNLQQLTNPLQKIQQKQIQIENKQFTIKICQQQQIIKQLKQKLQIFENSTNYSILNLQEKIKILTDQLLIKQQKIVNLEDVVMLKIQRNQYLEEYAQKIQKQFQRIKNKQSVSFEVQTQQNLQSSHIKHITKQIKSQNNRLLQYQNLNNQTNTQECKEFNPNNKLSIQIQKLQDYENQDNKQKTQKKIKYQLIQLQQKHKELEQQYYKLEIKLNKKQELFKRQQSQKIRKQQIIQSLFEQKIKQIQQNNQKRLQKFIEKQKKTQIWMEKIEKERNVVQSLAIGISHSIDLLKSIEMNKKIKKQIEKISENLKTYLKEYQQSMQWDIQKEQPGYFLNISRITNKQLQESKQQIDQLMVSNQRQRYGYSFDLDNIPLLGKKLKNLQKQQPARSMIQVRPKLQNTSSIQQVQQKVQNDDYQNLRKLYHQALQCLEMQTKKTKSIQIQYQKFVQSIYQKQKLDSTKYSLQKQLVYFIKLTQQQQQTIETQRKQYNKTFKIYHEQFKHKMSQLKHQIRLKSLTINKDSNNKFIN